MTPTEKLAEIVGKKGIKETYSRNEVLEIIIEAYYLGRNELAEIVLKDLDRLEMLNKKLLGRRR